MRSSMVASMNVLTLETDSLVWIRVKTENGELNHQCPYLLPFSMIPNWADLAGTKLKNWHQIRLVTHDLTYQPI